MTDHTVATVRTRSMTGRDPQPDRDSDSEDEAGFASPRERNQEPPTEEIKVDGHGREVEPGAVADNVESPPIQRGPASTAEREERAAGGNFDSAAGVPPIDNGSTEPRGLQRQLPPSVTRALPDEAVGDNPTRNSGTSTRSHGRRSLNMDTVVQPPPARNGVGGVQTPPSGHRGDRAVGREEYIQDQNGEIDINISTLHVVKVSSDKCERKPLSHRILIR